MFLLGKSVYNGLFRPYFDLKNDVLYTHYAHSYPQFRQ